MNNVNTKIQLQCSAHPCTPFQSINSLQYMNTKLSCLKKKSQFFMHLPDYQNIDLLTYISITVYVAHVDKKITLYRDIYSTFFSAKNNFMHDFCLLNHLNCTIYHTMNKRLLTLVLKNIKICIFFNCSTLRCCKNTRSQGISSHSTELALSE